MRSRWSKRVALLALTAAVAVAAGVRECRASTPPKTPARPRPLAVQVRRLPGPQGPTLVTHPKETFREVVRCFVRYGASVWFGTYGRGLFRLGDSSLESFRAGASPLLEDRVNCLATLGSELWIGTCAGINVYDGKGWRAIRAGEGPAHNIYHAIEPDGRGGMWVGTTGKGLSHFDGRVWKTVTVADGLAGDWVNDMLELPGGQTWAACLGGLAVRPAGGRWRVERSELFPLYKNVVALARQGDSLWAGFGDCGLFMTEAGKWYRPPPQLLPAPTVRALVVDRAGVLWIATESGIGTYSTVKDWETRGASAGLQDRDIRSLYIDPRTEDMYAGSARGTVYRRSRGDDQWKVLVRQGRLVASGGRDREEASR